MKKYYFNVPAEYDRNSVEDFKPSENATRETVADEIREKLDMASDEYDFLLIWDAESFHQALNSDQVNTEDGWVGTFTI